MIDLCVILTVNSNLKINVVFTTAEQCNTYAKCLTCPAEAPFTCTSCEKGYYLARGGAYYTCQQCLDACLECEDIYTCNGCEKGRYGIECQDVCSKGCANSTCSQQSGHCDCMANYTGPKCDMCISGKYGYEFNCELNCPLNCKTCILNTDCTQCKDGYYGQTCQHNCSNGCYSGHCWQVNGTCLGNKCKPNFEGFQCERCVAGRFGKDCEKACHTNCLSCNSDTFCDTCKSGFWGIKCENKCAYDCFEDVCVKESGICKNNKCKSGFSGDRCENCIAGKRWLKCNMNTATGECVFKNCGFKRK